MASSAGASCVHSGCTCHAFRAQFYRPAHCLVCFHTIADHYPEQWTRDGSDPTRVAFRHLVSGEVLYSRPEERRRVLMSSSAARTVAERGAALQVRCCCAGGWLRILHVRLTRCCHH